MITVKLTHGFFGEFICPNEFRGWDKLEYSLVRSEKYHGVFDGFGLSLTFFGPALRFLSRAYERDGADVFVQVEVTEANGLGDVLTTTGLLNFSEDATFRKLGTNPVIEPDFLTLEVIPVASDLKTLLESRRKNKIQLPVALQEVYNLTGSPLFWQDTQSTFLDNTDFDGNSLEDLRLFRRDKIYLHGRAKFRQSILGPEALPAESTQGGAGLFDDDWWISQELKVKNDDLPGASETIPFSNGNPSTMPAFFTTANVASFRAKINYSGIVRWQNSGLTSNSFLQLRLGYGTSPNDKFIVLFQTANNVGFGTSATQDFNVSFTASFFLNPTESVWLYWRIALPPAAVGINNTVQLFTTSQTVEIGRYDYSDGALRDGYFIHEFMAAILRHIIGRECLFSSAIGRPDSYPTTYDDFGPASLLSVFSGKGLRFQVGPLSTSFDEAFDSLQAVFSVGLWVNKDTDKITIDMARNLYRKSVKAAQFDNVENISISVAGDRLYNEASFAYNKYESRGANLAQDIHGKVGFNAPLKFSDKSYSLNSAYLASGESIDLAMRRPADGETAKTGYDEDKFFVCIAKSKRVRIPVLGADANGNFIIVPNSDVKNWYLSRFSITAPAFNPIPLSSLPVFFAIVNGGANNGIYPFVGILAGGVLDTVPALPDPTQIIIGQTYIEVITKDEAFDYIAQTTENYSLIQNYELPSSGYNFDISPTRSLLRHKWMWNQGMLKKPNGLWRFAGGEGNVLFISKKDAAPFGADEYLQDPLKQNQSIVSKDDTLGPVSLPEHITFEAPVTIKTWQSLMENRHGVVWVSNSDKEHFKGYIIEAKRVRNGERVIGKFKLLRAV